MRGNSTGGRWYSYPPSSSIFILFKSIFKSEKYIIVQTTLLSWDVCSCDEVCCPVYLARAFRNTGPYFGSTSASSTPISRLFGIR